MIIIILNVKYHLNYIILFMYKLWSWLMCFTQQCKLQEFKVVTMFLKSNCMLHVQNLIFYFLQRKQNPSYFVGIPAMQPECKTYSFKVSSFCVIWKRINTFKWKKIFLCLVTIINHNASIFPLQSMR